jgi:hypothetical protein
MLDSPSKPRRQWFQFGMGTMFVVVTVVAGFSAWYGPMIAQWVENRRRDRQFIEALNAVESFPITFDPDGGITGPPIDEKQWRALKASSRSTR